MKMTEPEMYLREKTVLVVDDVTENIDILLGILSSQYRVRVATSGQGALDQVEREVPDLILLDIMMPGISGFDVCAQLKQSEHTKDVPVIFITALSDKSNEERGLRLGAVDYIYKPFSSDLVRARVRNHLQLYMKRRDLEREISLRTKSINQIKNALIASLAFITEARDPDTGEHIFRTQHYYELLARQVHKLKPGLFAEEDIDMLAISSSLHDIGKIGIPDLILQKCGPLTEEEYREICTHTTVGSDLLHKTQDYLGSDAGVFLTYAAEIAEYHHEHWDGTGYPKGLRGEQIPVSARLMAIVDVYDALRSRRPYKEPLSHEKAVKIITEGDGRTMPAHFDPLVLKAFIEIEGGLEAISGTRQSEDIPSSD
jgi:putative two-component system response regulator